ncbi:uncharacterized protein LOC129944166 [Eupeodes corollae]|uniref:uncharacterized protein LOC129944166 n=1 Tax=Eupeodes corollae TaxID=290404 RepID=UPI0024931411|nr:uncharacterized protein LOC129944166 [Eupeodes corollae]
MFPSHQRLKIVLLILTIQSFAENSGPLINDTLLRDLLRPLSEITLRLHSNEDFSNGFIQFFLNQSLCPVKVLSYNFVERNQSRNSVILTYDDDINKLKSVFEKFSTNRQGVRFYIIDHQFKPSALIDIAYSLWNRVGIFKNYYLTSKGVYFYNPLILEESTGKYGAFQNTTSCEDFERIFTNINGYPLRTYIFRSVYASLVFDKENKEILRAEGADGHVAYTIEKVMNGKLVLLKPDDAFFGYHLPNGSYNGAIGRSIRYETDLVLTGFFVKDYYTQDMEFSVAVYMDKLCCYVSKAKRIPQSILPLFSVKVDMWVGFIGAAFVWTAIWIVIRRINLWVNRKRGRQFPEELNKFIDWQYFQIFSDTWVIWVRANLCQYPPFLSEKVFVISLCLVSVIFGAIFESSLATVYINPLYYNDINTMAELDESQLKILIKHAAMKDDLFFGSDLLVFKRLDKKLLYVTDIVGPIIDVMSKKGGFASVTRASSLILDDISYILSQKIHQIPECPKNYHIAYVYPKESPFKERVNDILLRFLNGGLINHWIEMMYHEAKIGILKSPEILQVMGGYTWKVLTIKDLQLAFYVIIGGSVISTLVVISEIYIAKRSRNK